jgi:ATP-binding cassette subfamily B protein
MSLTPLTHRHLLRTYLAPQWRAALLLALLLFGHIALQLLNPQIVRAFLDAAEQGAALPVLLRAALLFLGVALLNQLLSVSTTYMSERVGWQATNHLRADLALHCLQLDLPFHKAHTPGEMIERIDGDVTALANFFSQFVIRMLGSLVLLTGVLFLLYREAWQVGLLVTLAAAILLALLHNLRTLVVPYWEKARQASADLFGFLEERLGGTEDLRANGATPYILRRFYLLLRARLHHERAAASRNALVTVTPVAISTLSRALALALSGALFLNGTITTIGTVYLIFSYTSLLFEPLHEITRQVGDLQKAGASIGRIGALFNQRSTIIQSDSGNPLPSGPLAVEFQDVSFEYDTDTPVLHHISFRLEPGRVLGLLGRTGSGKSTLTRLLLRLYDPTAGTILLSGLDTRHTHLADLRHRIGVVTQDVQLFHGTIRDNLTFYGDHLPDERLLQVLADLELWDWYQSLPAGLDTPLAGTQSLSAGEAQLLAFARVFLADPGLIILDEASSRLDPLTEQRLERAIAKLLANRTAIIIAHRLETLQRADDILILASGTIIEHGPRPHLTANPHSRLSQLLQTTATAELL